MKNTVTVISSGNAFLSTLIFLLNTMKQNSPTHARSALYFKNEGNDSKPKIVPHASGKASIKNINQQGTGRFSICIIPFLSIFSPLFFRHHVYFLDIITKNKVKPIYILPLYKAASFEILRQNNRYSL